MSSLIFTNHVKDRIHDRRMNTSQIEHAFHSPDKKYSGKEAGTTVFEKQFGSQRVTVITKQNDRHEWIVISAWIDPPHAGTQDAKKRAYWQEYRRAGFWGKWWVMLKQSLGL
ncbi:MAG: hypothetical protein ABI758_01920 [Candidatus Woesebacteria bacterium]